MQTEVHTGQIGLGFMDQIERFHGCLLGLAIGMLWVTLEFKPPGTFKPITDMIGGPFGWRFA